MLSFIFLVQVEQSYTQRICNEIVDHFFSFIMF